jgi:peptidylprolyl isomerase
MSSLSRSRSAVFLALGTLLPLGFHGCATDHLPDGLYARIYTTRGPVLARLEPNLTPLAVANFVGLAEGTIENAAFDPGRPFYDGTVIHRVEAGHVIQMGIPPSDRANGPGYVFPNEMHASLSHDHAGALNFANGGPNTNAAQWCITLGDRSYLDGDYIVFGNVVEGMEVVFSIVRDDVIDSVRIVRVGERASAFHPDTESFRVMVQAAEARVAEQAVLKREAEEAWIRENYPELATPRDSVRSAVLSPGSLPREGEGPVQARYRGTRIRYVGHLLGHEGPAVEATAFGSREDGLPGFVDPPRAFPVDPGVTSINPALDRVLAEMTPGERRIVVIPSEFGYGRAGIYPPETPGEPRFVIGPNTLLVYELELLGG